MYWILCEGHITRTRYVYLGLRPGNFYVRLRMLDVVSVLVRGMSEKGSDGIVDTTGARSLLYQIPLPAPYIAIQIMCFYGHINVIWYIRDYERLWSTPCNSFCVMIILPSHRLKSRVSSVF